ncbi:hypothetical protein MKW98_015551 [Papaver atlanticum]|uniref:Uncharacterized protein n=1 Tax=Papaver atlanticum TaxID=357466 RepID=A0AAD4S597_9MAGN|nr:hypothetical protein MKW98_015551 [Papaver atlanticum]
MSIVSCFGTIWSCRWTSVEIKVLQGEKKFVRDNKSHGCLHLDGIPLAQDEEEEGEASSFEEPSGCELLPEAMGLCEFRLDSVN